MTQLDGLRAIAVAAVVFEHFVIDGSALGRLGVTLFFVLSGFLITRILLRSRELDLRLGESLRRFYARRFLRIFPVYYLTLAVLWALGVRQDFGWHVAYLTDLHLSFGGVAIPATAHFWSLSVEEQFYLVWPLVVLLTPPRRLVWTVLAMIATSTGLRLAMWRYAPGAAFHDVFPLLCLDSLGAGCLIAIKPEWSHHVRYIGRLAVPAFAISFAYDLFGSVSSPILISLAVCVFAWLVSQASVGFSGPFGRLLVLRPVTYIGTISYAIYLFHLPILYVIARDTHLNNVADRIIATVLTIAAASLSWHLFERPINSLKRHFEYRGGKEEPGERLAAPRSGIAVVDESTRAY